jgi:hypothetical protein
MNERTYRRAARYSRRNRSDGGSTVNDGGKTESNMRKFLIGSIAVLGLTAVPAMAQDATGTASGGASVSTPSGSAAGGATGGAHVRGRHHGRAGDTSADAANSSSTYGSGSVYTDRNRATGGVAAGGTATGSGDQSSSTSVDAYGATDKSGSTGEVYGDSSATSTNPTSTTTSPR